LRLSPDPRFCMLRGIAAPCERADTVRAATARALFFAG
jgi:hypothetical protein